MWEQCVRRKCLEAVLECLVAFGDRRTNAVLEILKDHTLHERHRYPPDGITFGGGNWRAFYHCHDSPRGDGAEHGHFHLFAVLGPLADEWTHVVGLSIDRQGQPVQWFAVNRWVTGGPWLPRDELVPLLPCPDFTAEPGLVERWLAAMVCAFKDDIAAVLESRDQNFSSRLAGREPEEVQGDRSLYVLASRPVDLQRTLENVLVREADMPDPDHDGSWPVRNPETDETPPPNP